MSEHDSASDDNPSVAASGPTVVSSHQTVSYNKYGEVVDLSDYKGSISSYQQVATWKYEDEESGCYANAKLKGKTTTGKLYKEKGSGRVGYKDEVKQTSTFKIGHKTGYTEYQYKERIRKVNFGNTKDKKEETRMMMGDI